ncbi:MAG: hypothetical protein CMO55_11885 [Verrucomicrobiales bacterium]|nr:hypothetical protein [Verrucomicrobiales bacterium]
MSRLDKTLVSAKDLSPKARRIGVCLVALMKVFAVTFRWRCHDPDNLRENLPETPMIWICWHNRIFVLADIYRRYLPSRSGAVLTSASRDGEIIAKIISMYKVAAIRGSSSRRAVAALVALKDWLKEGYDVGIIPDGPRGPRYKLGPGTVKLAQMTGAQILPFRIEYGSYWSFKSWDKFRLPKPFTTVDVYLEPLISIPKELDDEAFEQERLRVENALNPDHEVD